MQFARAEASRLAHEPVDLCDVISEMADELWPQAQQKKVEFIQEGCEEPCLVLGDLSLLARAFGNLFQNAVKYSPAGGRIVVALAREDGRVRIGLRALQTFRAARCRR